MGVPGCPDFACCTASMHRVRMVLMQSSSIGPRGVFISYPAKSNPFPFRHIGERVGGPLKDLFQRPINVHDNRNIFGWRKGTPAKMHLPLKSLSGRPKMSRTLTCDALRRRQDDPGHSQKISYDVRHLPIFVAASHSSAVSKRSPEQRRPAWMGVGRTSGRFERNLELASSGQ